MAGTQTDDPVDVTFRPGIQIGRLWGIPFVGLWIRALILIPHFIVLYVIGFVAVILSLVTWIPVLVSGRYPSWGYRWVGGYLRWSARLNAYLSFLTGAYPAFSLGTQPTDDIWVRIDEGQSINRLWGIPFVGLWVRSLILIPHFVILLVLGIVAGILALFSWIPVLLFGRQSSLVYTIVGGNLRWSTRVLAYLFLMTDRYPPFSLE